MPRKSSTCWSLLVLSFLLVATLSHRYVSGSENDDPMEGHSSGTSQHMMDQSTLVFFTLDKLKLGKVLPVYFRATNNPSTSPSFLPRQDADSIPFSLSKLDHLLQYFGFALGSPQAIAMESTLRECTAVKPIKGETKFCATSLESMLDFVQEMLGGASVEARVLNTQNVEKSSTNVLKKYTIVEEPREVEAAKMVACHTMPYPYVVYYCHYQKSESKVFQVSLKSGENKGIEAVAVCHMDTSQWSQTHISFQLLGIKPGNSPVCHFFPSDNLVWVPSPSTNIHLS